MKITINNSHSTEMWITFEGENNLTLPAGGSVTLSDDYGNGTISIFADHIETHQILRPQQ
ncbi:MAG: hypothetical protein NTW50_02640 [Candidatus Berkelbacteria bacterium]|nr:hypothetical protein [Candidatus Berkelbacteria bacterium]